jgi:AsmA protein
MTGDRSGVRKAVWITGVALVLLTAAIVAIPIAVDANRLRPELEVRISDAIGREVKIGHLHLSVWSGAIGAEEISIADDPEFGRTPFVHAKSLSIGVEMRPLILSRTIKVTGVVINSPVIQLARSNSGRWNFSSFGRETTLAPPAGNAGTPSAGTPSADVTIRELKITDGRVTVRRGGADPKTRVYDKVEIQARDLSLGSDFPYLLTANLPGGGTVKLDGRLGPLNRTDASLTPLAAALEVKALSLTGSGIVDTQSGLAGTIDFSGRFSSDGKTARSKGRSSVTGFRLVRGGVAASRPVSLAYALSYSPQNHTGSIAEATAEFGKAVAKLNGTFALSGESTTVKLRLRANDMPADDLEAFLPALGVTMPRGASLHGGRLAADLSAEGPIDRLVTKGNIEVADTRLDGFDLGSKLAAVASLAGIKPSAATAITKFSSDLHVTSSGIAAGNLFLAVPALGQLTGNGTVGGDSSLDFKMLATLSSSGGLIGGIGRLAGAKAGTELRVPFSIRGTTSNPTFVPDVKATARGLLESVVPGKDGKPGEKDPVQELRDSLKQLLERKPKKQ